MDHRLRSYQPTHLNCYNKRSATSFITSWSKSSFNDKTPQYFVFMTKAGLIEIEYLDKYWWVIFPNGRRCKNTKKLFLDELAVTLCIACMRPDDLNQHSKEISDG